MTEAEIIRWLINGAVAFVTAALFVRILCDEYQRELESEGLVRPPVAPSGPDEAPVSEAPARRPGAPIAR